MPNHPHHHRKYTVRVGEHSLKNKDESEQERAVAQSIPHPCYNNSNNDHSYDVMLIQLRGRVPLGPKVKPIKLADHCPQVGQKCTISGWGTVTSPLGSGRERRSWLAQWTPSHWRRFASRADEEGNVTEVDSHGWSTLETFKTRILIGMMGEKETDCLIGLRKVDG